jgi:hypothetical protein
MARRNKDRTGPRTKGSDEIPADLKQMMNPMDFVAPTDIVDLPSKGACYPEGHPLHEKDTIEIRYMTAKDEDILTSRSLLKKGIALDRLISNLIVDKSINAKHLLVGDRNAIIINARASAYGHMYETTVTCPSCNESQKHSFDLTDPKVYHGDNWEDYEVEKTEKGTYKATLPFSKIEVEMRLLVGADETQILKSISNSGKGTKEDSLITNQMRAFIVAVNEYDDPKIINYFVANIIAQEARLLRNIMKAITPDLRIADDFECASCSHEQELEVPFGADFFWPDR